MNKILLIFLLIFLQSEEAFTQYEVNKVKAEVFERFIRFVNWPENKKDSAGFEIVIFGKSEFGDYLFQSLNKPDKFLKGSKVIIRKCSNITEIENPDLIYIAASSKSEVTNINQYIRGKNILTVADFQYACENAVMVNLTLENKKIKIEINLGEAKKEGLKIDALLLNYARLVQTKP